METRPSYPFAQGADLICSAQKDALHQADLHQNILDVVRRLGGARWTQGYHREIQSLSLLLYSSLTTLLGNQTLGEEYCEIVPVESQSRQLPSFGRRTGYVFASGILPYLLTVLLPHFSGRVLSQPVPDSRASAGGQEASTPPVPGTNFLRQAFTLASPVQLHALYLAVFYLRGTYYQITKQVFQIRYIYFRSSDATAERGGYEVLGLLLLLQVIAQTASRAQGVLHGSVSESPGDQSSSGATSLHPASRSEVLGKATHTPKHSADRFHLDRTETMAWIQGVQRRKCVLCLEHLKSPSVTACGHTFCWACILAWTQEKPECPLCRQAVAAQHVLPIRY